MILTVMRRRCASLTANRAKIRRTRAHFATRRGATAVEMAMVAPFIFLIVFGSMEFSRIVMVKQALTNSAREGCRVASLATTQDATDVDDAVRHYVQRCFQDYDDQNVVKVTVTPSDFSEVTSGTEITTTVEVHFSNVSWLPANWGKNTILIGTATMNRE